MSSGLPGGILIGEIEGTLRLPGEMRVGSYKWRKGQGFTATRSCSHKYITHVLACNHTHRKYEKKADYLLYSVSYSIFICQKGLEKICSYLLSVVERCWENKNCWVVLNEHIVNFRLHQFTVPSLNTCRMWLSCITHSAVCSAVDIPHLHCVLLVHNSGCITGE